MAYFPLELGRYVDYSVDSTVWSSFFCTEVKRHLYLRYTVADTFSDEQLRKSYRIEVRQRIKDTDPWTALNNIYVTTTDHQLEYVQNNLRFVKLVFPVVEGKYWDGNSMIATADADNSYFSNWIYRYASVGKAYNNGLVDFDQTVSVDQVNESLNATEPGSYSYKTFAREVYQFNVGMIYRETTHWVQQPDSSGLSTCKEGYSVIMRAVDHN